MYLKIRNLTPCPFCTPNRCRSATGYSYFFVGEQKRMEQTKRRGRRVSILGIWQPQVSFTYGLSIGGFDTESYIKMMDEQAQQAAQMFQENGRIRVIAQDNGPIHTSAAVKAKQPEWEAQGLYLFFFAKYCSEMNPIELEWQHLKKDEIAGRMFEDELDLAYALMDGDRKNLVKLGEPSHYNTSTRHERSPIQGSPSFTGFCATVDARAKAQGHTVERFRFKKG